MNNDGVQAGGIVNSAATNVTATGYVYSAKLYVHKYGEVSADSEVDISSLVQFFTITEDLGLQEITVRLSIGDTNGYYNKYKITGDEKIKLTVTRKMPPKLTDGLSPLSETQEIKLDLRIIEVQNLARARDGVLTYSFNCVTEHVHEANKLLLKRSFNGSIGTLVKNICTGDLKIPSDKLEIQTDGVNIIKGIYPRLKPRNAMNWLRKHSHDSQTPLFLYQTSDGILHFKSYKKLLEDGKENKEYFTYIYKPGVSAQDTQTFNEERELIRNLSSRSGSSKFIAVQEGAYASSLQHIDISTKTHTNTPFTHKGTGENKTLESQKPFSAQEKYEETLDSKTYYISKNSMSFQTSDENAQNMHEDSSKSEVNSILANLKSYQYVLSLAGDLDLQVGQVINLNIIGSSSNTNEEGELNTGTFNKYISGKYLVTNILREFQDKFLQKVTVVRDSTAVDIDVNDDSGENS